MFRTCLYIIFINCDDNIFKIKDHEIVLQSDVCKKYLIQLRIQ